jgi:glycosyltransferase involved in cell wall biosynthesis
MNVFVQIPCLNEEETLPLVLESIPRSIKGVDNLEILIIDDGSTDKTIEVAKKYGVKHFVHHRRTMGLARSFTDGVDYALAHGADIVVNTDGDNQYPQERIGDLIEPIVDGRADIVIADRQTQDIAHFSWSKKLLQRLGSRVVNYVAGTDLPDAVSGFRAYSKDSLMMLNIVSRFSYTTETIIQAGVKKLEIASVPITTNPKLRESRLFKSHWEMVRKQANAIIRAYVMYKPLVIFVTLSVGLLVVGLVPFLRYMYFTFSGDHGNHLQSLIIGAILLIGSFLSMVLGIVADLIRINRVLQEQQLEHTKRGRYLK